MDCAESFLLVLATSIVAGAVEDDAAASGSAMVFRFGDLESYKNSRLGTLARPIHDAMAQATRLAGDHVTVVAAWYQ